MSSFKSIPNDPNPLPIERMPKELVDKNSKIMTPSQLSYVVSVFSGRITVPYDPSPIPYSQPVFDKYSTKKQFRRLGWGQISYLVKLSKFIHSLKKSNAYDVVNSDADVEPDDFSIVAKTTQLAPNLSETKLGGSKRKSLNKKSRKSTKRHKKSTRRHKKSVKK